MSTTERLYYTDSHLTEFEARVTGIIDRVSGWATVTLDRTAFYPTGGGQPSDTGFIGEARVVECIDESASGVLHVVQGRTPKVGDLVRGHVDWPRRQDHMQQHTGQHILSQAFIALFDAETRGFRMLDQSSEVDVALDEPTDERIERAVQLANSIIWDDRPVHVRQVTQEEAAQLSLRKESTRSGELRIIEIEGFDLTPCGGTHVRRTGEVGLIAVRHWERAKGLTRVEFIAGNRALADYDRANRTARAVAALFSAGRDDAPAQVSRLQEAHKQLLRRVRVLEEMTTRVEAEELLAETNVRPDGARIIARNFEGRDAESLKRLAQAIIAQTGCVALLGSSDEGAARLVFARAADGVGDMNALMREACALLDGRGGGRPDLAQGGGRHVEKLSEAIAAAARTLHAD
ncbi:MAG TPA: DHHA1 domain-containing protein [Pyrinomonadaceae bacterium]|jgi:alanyl-tRNA synthetase|nr:DHHA1 domain-containing protein [Pyrinomonadaceae bacterium]